MMVVMTTTTTMCTLPPSPLLLRCTHAATRRLCPTGHPQLPPRWPPCCVRSARRLLGRLTRRPGRRRTCRRAPCLAARAAARPAPDTQPPLALIRADLPPSRPEPPRDRRPGCPDPPQQRVALRLQPRRRNLRGVSVRLPPFAPQHPGVQQQLRGAGAL